MYHYLDDYFSPYSDFSSLQNNFSFIATLNPRLCHVHLLLKIAVQEVGSSHRAYPVHSHIVLQVPSIYEWKMLHNRREHLIVIYTLPLSIALGYQTGHVTHTTIQRSFFLCINLFASNGLLSFGQLCEFLCVVDMERLNLLHRSLPSQLRLRV